MHSAANPVLKCGKRTLDLTRAHIMGILNVTPDSFSDGGRYTALQSALARALEMAAAGATIIDIGGESTRPGAAAVSAQQELDRVAPLVELINRECDVIISVDTSTPAVMRESARLGAGMINDVRALQRDGALDAVAATRLPVCLMHMRGEPQTMQDAPHYDDVAAEVSSFLQERIVACAQAGISAERIVLDPGFGFAKDTQHNYELFNRLPELSALQRPLLIGVSRKSMVGNILQQPVERRLYGSLALAVMALERGAKILRVHDVEETMDVLKIFNAVHSAAKD
ncbi:dihydropteroate synthase [Pseudomonas sp. C27(2019)]|uniref:dihydropteroate synthase n=1 Tax=Pseudomonas sp. C27(2019) TaxID=2604941 RepID=UPI001247383E|nr:dihydropteroate synthase [Pseudomonas sp. C27(2019)]QEY59513.1 dihydropteroate synthase [Pseudomonas sp. C27(2019)]